MPYVYSAVSVHDQAQIRLGRQGSNHDANGGISAVHGAENLVTDFRKPDHDLDGPITASDHGA